MHRAESRCVIPFRAPATLRAGVSPWLCSPCAPSPWLVVGGLRFRIYESRVPTLRQKLHTLTENKGVSDYCRAKSFRGSLLIAFLIRLAYSQSRLGGIPCFSESPAGDCRR